MKILKALAVLALAFTVYNTNAQCSGYSVLIDLVPDTTCVGDPVLINATTGSSMSTFSWQLPSGQILSGSSSLYSNSVVLADSGRYIVTANSGPCTAKDTAYLKIGTRPALTPSVTTNIPVCIGDTLTFDIIPAQTFPGIGYALYDGSNNKLSSTKLTKIPNASVAHMGYYKIAVTDSFGCATSVNYLLGSGDINPKPANPKISPSKNPACVGETVVLTATGIPSSQFRVWTDYNNNQQPNFSTYTFNNTATAGTYRFTVYADNMGCKSDIDTAMIEILPVLNPLLNVTVNPGTKVGPYAPVMFTANVADAGSAATYQWVKNGANITGETGTTLSMIAGQDFASGDKISLSMNTNNTCATPSALNSNVFTLYIDLGVNDMDSKDGIRFYPNPVQDKLIVEGAADEQLTLTGINGMQVTIGNRLSKDGDKVIINTVGLPAGVYLLRAGDKAARFTKAE